MGAIYLSESDFKKLAGKKSESKYHAKKMKLDGEVYDSRKEGCRYAGLRLLERSGEIRDLKKQVPFTLIPVQRDKQGKCIERAVKYVADFVYYTRSGERIVEDTKGVRTADYIIKRKLMLYVHGIRIKEV